MSFRRASNIFYVVLMALLLGACGFHLRGVSQWPERLNPVYLESAQLEPHQSRQIRDALTRSGARQAASSESAVQLRVILEPLKSRRIASSSLSSVELVQLTMRLQYSLQGPLGEPLVDSREMTQSRELELDTNNVLSHQDQKEQVTQELQQSLIRSMIYQLTQL